MALTRIKAIEMIDFSRPYVVVNGVEVFKPNEDYIVRLQNDLMVQTPYYVEASNFAKAVAAYQSKQGTKVDDAVLSIMGVIDGI